jgi:hypothetical protein
VNRVRLRIPQPSLWQYVTGKRKLSNVPPDAKITSMRTEQEWCDGIEVGGWLWLTLEHESFPPLEPGGRYPRLKPRFHKEEQAP